MILKANDTVALVACSNPYSKNRKPELNNLISTLESFKLNVLVSPYIFEENFSPQNKAKILNEYFEDKNIKLIFDISGGDLCNEILPFLNFEKIRNTFPLYCGYSDNSVLINALYKLSSKYSLNYQVNRLIGSNSEYQKSLFKDYFFKGEPSLLTPNFTWINGNYLKGTVIGGNLRCTLKISGTKFMPDFSNKILFLESLGGDKNKVITYLNQYAQIGAFQNLNGIILGEFTEFEEKESLDTLLSLLVPLLPNKSIPIIKTSELGHSQNSKAIYIGNEIILRKS